MSRIYMYHRDYPQGKIFDTEPNKQDPLIPPNGTGWFDSPHFLQMTRDDVVEAVVKQELAKQSSDRELLDKEHKKKFGYEPRGVEPDKNVEKALDIPTKRKKK